jgi:ABC-type multidrug transport system fused ATPase/permease subunit
MISTWDFDVVGEQITHELQERYLSSVLQRNIAYFDVLGTGELTSYMDQDMQLIQAGISQKVSYIISGVSGFVAAIIVAFMYNQKFASIMISQPLALILWVGSMGYWLSITQKKGLTQYVKADNLAQGVLNAMRNVVAYRSQERYSRKYFDTLQRPAALEFRERLIFGVIVAGSFTTLPSHMALDDVSFDVLAGAFIALVGTTGSGKSSVINLVERFYTAQSGNIILSDKAIGEYDLDGYRQYLALVDQNPCLVGEDMRECLQSDERVISDDDILVALQGVGLANFVVSDT